MIQHSIFDTPSQGKVQRQLFLLDLQNFLSLQLVTSLLLWDWKTECRAELPGCGSGSMGLQKLLWVKGAGSTAKLVVPIRGSRC